MNERRTKLYNYPSDVVNPHIRKTPDTPLSPSRLGNKQRHEQQQQHRHMPHATLLLCHMMYSVPGAPYFEHRREMELSVRASRRQYSAQARHAVPSRDQHGHVKLLRLLLLMPDSTGTTSTCAHIYRTNRRSNQGRNFLLCLLQRASAKRRAKQMLFEQG